MTEEVYQLRFLTQKTYKYIFLEEKTYVGSSMVKTLKCL